MPVVERFDSNGGGSAAVTAGGAPAADSDGGGHGAATMEARRRSWWVALPGAGSGGGHDGATAEAPGDDSDGPMAAVTAGSTPGVDFDGGGSAAGTANDNLYAGSNGGGHTGQRFWWRVATGRQQATFLVPMAAASESDIN